MDYGYTNVGKKISNTLKLNMLFCTSNVINTCGQQSQDLPTMIIGV